VLVGTKIIINNNNNIKSKLVLLTRDQKTDYTVRLVLHTRKENEKLEKLKLNRLAAAAGLESVKAVQSMFD